MQNRLKVALLMFWTIFVLVLTTQSQNDVPLVYFVGSTIGSTEYGAAFGHAGLFFMLTLMIFTALRLLFGVKIALATAMLIALILATGTEFYQLTLPDRSASLPDLLANWLGVFIIGFIVSFIHQEKRVHS
jgi:hypothetical protein